MSSDRAATSRVLRPFLIVAGLLYPAALCALPIVSTTTPVQVSTPAASAVPPVASTMTLTMIHPTEGQHLPALSQIFVYGAVTPGSTLTINGMPIPVHPKGGYLAMVPVRPGDFLLSAETTGALGSSAKLERHVFVAPPSVPLPENSAILQKETIQPSDNLILQPGDHVRVSFQASPGGSAEFSIQGLAQHVPMSEIGLSAISRRGLYEGYYIIGESHGADPGGAARGARNLTNLTIDVVYKKKHSVIKAKAPGRLTIDSGTVPRVGLIAEDVVAARTAPEGGYDLFLFRGMRVRLTGKVGGQYRIRLSEDQTGWIKESAVQPLPPGMGWAQSMVTNLTIAHQEVNTVVRAPLSDMLPYRTEQSLNPPRLTVTLYGAVDKTDLIKYDPLDPYIREVRWKQASADSVQLIIEPRFAKWWGYDVRYEGTTLVVEIRKPWLSPDLRGMIIAVDPGHGGSDLGAIGPHGTLEKDANLLIARAVKEALEKAGARPFLTRDRDMDVPLYDRPRIAWRGGARIFVSVHCNASGEGENPQWSNGFSTYWYQPQSAALAEAVHSAYVRQLTIPDHGLYFADLAVCRATQMPAILTEQAYIIVPEQEDLIFEPRFQRQIASSIVEGIKAFIGKP